MIKMKRQEYLDKYSEVKTEAERKAIHRKYYAQFVTPQIKDLVVSSIGRAQIIFSKDYSFNDIPLIFWDKLVESIPASIRKQLKAAGDTLSLSAGVCILKEAALQIKEENLPS